MALIWAAALATQFVAAELGYHRHLGPWMYRAPERALWWLRVGALAFAVAAAVCLATSRRWAAVPLAALAISMVAVRHGPIYAPTRIFVWYSAYHGVAAYARLFHIAWSVFAGSAVALVVSALRVLGGPPTGTS